MNFDETKRSAEVMEVDLASVAGAQLLSWDLRLQPADCRQGQYQICQLRAPDAAHNLTTPHITSPAVKDGYDRWSPKSGIKWAHRHCRGMAHRL